MALFTGTPNNNYIVDTNLDDQIYGFDGNDRIDLSGGNDYVEGGAGNDTVYGGRSGNKVVFLGAGQDTFDGHKNNSSARVYGGDDNDSIMGTKGNDSLYGDDGDDWLNGWFGNDLLLGGRGADNLHGNDGNDTLTGGDGNDYLGGGDGDDRLRGGRGVDELSGDDHSLRAQPGADRFIFDDGETGVGAGNRDIIHDFSRSEGDEIDLSLIDAHVYSSGDQAFVWRAFPLFDAPGQLTAIYDAARGYTVVAGNVDNDSAPEFEIQLEGALVAQNDFIL